MTAALLDDTAIARALTGLSGWRRDGNELRARYRLPTFAAAVELTTAIATVAEELDHHPEWTVAYREVALLTTTHDAGGLTQLDVDLAHRIAGLAKERAGEVVTQV